MKREFYICKISSEIKNPEKFSRGCDHLVEYVKSTLAKAQMGLLV